MKILCPCIPSHILLAIASMAARLSTDLGQTGLRRHPCHAWRRLADHCLLDDRHDLLPAGFHISLLEEIHPQLRVHAAMCLRLQL